MNNHTYGLKCVTKYLENSLLHVHVLPQMLYKTIIVCISIFQLYCQKQHSSQVLLLFTSQIRRWKANDCSESSAIHHYFSLRLSIPDGMPVFPENFIEIWSIRYTGVSGEHNFMVTACYNNQLTRVVLATVRDLPAHSRQDKVSVYFYQITADSPDLECHISLTPFLDINNTRPCLFTRLYYSPITEKHPVLAHNNTNSCSLDLLCLITWIRSVITHKASLTVKFIAAALLYVLCSLSDSFFYTILQEPRIWLWSVAGSWCSPFPPWHWMLGVHSR